MAAIEGLLLDVDGTLVNSNDAHAHSWVAALAQHGITAPFDEVRPLIGMGGDKLLPEVAGIDAESPQGKAISKDRLDIFLKEYLPKLQPSRGAKELLQALKDRGLKMVVASSAGDKELPPLLKLCSADQVIDDQTSSDDAENSKPDPDIIHAALQKIDLSPCKTLLLGDTPYDIAAALKAGIGVIALRCGGWSDEKLHGAFAIYDDPADLLRQIERSPLAT